MSDPRNNYAFGDLNPAFSSDVKKRLPNSTDVKTSSLLRPIVENVYKSDALKAVGKIKAIALRVESSTLAEPGDWLSHDDDLEAGSDGLIRVRARIPELHPYPIPQDKNDHQAINLYPVFKAENTDINAKPEFGSIIWVDFGNRETQQDPIYLGPVIGSKTSTSGNGQTSSRSVSEGGITSIDDQGSVSIENPNTGDQIGAPPGPPAPIEASPTGGASFGKTLESIDWDSIPQSLLLKWRDKFRAASGPPSSTNPHPIESISDSLNRYQKFTIIAMGCAEVIEQYWKTYDSTAKVIITSHFRKRYKIVSGKFRLGNHCGAAIDFSVEVNPFKTITTKKGNSYQRGKKLSVLQVWTGLMKLAAAGRIPNGGKGLYLNVGPRSYGSIKTPGITGPTPEEAGGSSGSWKWPDGASGAPHYDFRGFYGFFSKKVKKEVNGVEKTVEWDRTKKDKNGNVIGSKYVWVDTDGNGKDDLKYSAARSWLRSKRNSVYKVFSNGWSSYEYSPEVSAAVPNLLDVLGQTLEQEDGENS